MKNSNIFALIFVIILAIGGVVYYTKSTQDIIPGQTSNNSQNQNSQNQLSANNSVDQTPIANPVKNTTPSQTPTLKPVVNTKLYTAQTVATHNTKTSCWTIVNGNVYDITSYITEHPGGQSKISSVCGIDGTSAFTGQHGGQSRPENNLAKFLLGPLQ
jgi:cytochrome b involved in lipid metabolism